MSKESYREQRIAVNIDIIIMSAEKDTSDAEANIVATDYLDRALSREGFTWKKSTGVANGVKEVSRVVFLPKDDLDYLTKMAFLKTLAFGAFKQDSILFASNGLTGSERVRTGYLVTPTEGTVDKGLFRAVPKAPANGEYTEIDGQIWTTER